MSECPSAEKHTPTPRGYVAWFSWAEAMATRGFHQVRCDGCGLYAIWTGTRALVDPAEHETACLVGYRLRRVSKARRFTAGGRE